MGDTWMHLPAVTYLPAGSDLTTGEPAEDVEEGSANPNVVEDGALVLSGDHARSSRVTLTACGSGR